jgi:serine/threonine protein kinase
MPEPPRAPKAPPRQQHDSLCLGTPGYAAPEQYPGSGLQPDPRADIYALGVILYQLLSQQNPAGLEVPLPPIRRFNTSVHPDLEQIIAKATAPDREQRYSSVKMFAKALAEFRQAKLLLSAEGVNRELKELASHYRPPVRAKAMGDLLKEVSAAKHDSTRVGTRFDAMKKTNTTSLRKTKKVAAGMGAAGVVLFLALLLVPGLRLPVLAVGAAGGAWYYNKRQKRRKRR